MNHVKMRKDYYDLMFKYDDCKMSKELILLNNRLDKPADAIYVSRDSLGQILLKANEGGRLPAIMFGGNTPLEQNENK